MQKRPIFAVLIVLVAAALAYFLYSSEVLGQPAWPFKLGLDLSGGTHLVYKADTSKLAAEDVKESMSSLRDVIERRVNLFGVSEPIVQEEQGANGENRLSVDLPGVTEIDQAVALIGQTPVLVFKTARVEAERDAILAAQKNQQRLNEDPYFIDSPLTGRYIEKATIEFNESNIGPVVSLVFNSEGSKLFEDLTRSQIGKPIGIYLDGAAISAPVVQEVITGGRAQISGNFTVAEARDLVGRLNAGALPVPIELISTQTVGASLGEDILKRDILAGLYGLIALAIFLILWYRLPGFLAVIALTIYTILMLVLFKLFGVVLTAAGIAGFILSIGMAVDANILIFERMKEEMQKGQTIITSLHEGFARAWPSIRDSNISSMITASVLFWMGTSLVKGFALTFGIGVVVSMFTAITVTRTFLYTISPKETPTWRALFSNGFGRS
ncbi:MAG: protein translocase subunit SecD [Patescibacteria group bacterium]